MHRTTRRFWSCFDRLPPHIQEVARVNFGLLRENPRHASLRFKKVGLFWSARVGRDYRALARESEDGFTWVWIGSHEDYNRMIRGGP